MVEGFTYNGRFYPVIAGGAEGPGAPAGGGGGESAPLESAAPEPASSEGVSEAPTEAGAEPASEETAEAPSRLHAVAQALLPREGTVAAPAPPAPPEAVLQARMAQIATQHLLEQQRLEAALPYLPEDQQQQALAEWALLTAERERQLVALERELQRAALEPYNRDLAIEELVRLAKQDNPDLDDGDLRRRLQQLARSGASAEAVLLRAVEYADDHRRARLAARKARRVDQMGGAGPALSNGQWKQMSLLDKLTYALRESDRQARRG